MHGTEEAGSANEQGQQAQGHETEEPQQVADSGAAGAGDYEAALRTKNQQIFELSAKVAEAAKTAKATSALNNEIEALKQQIEDERVEFALKAAGAHDVRAARALWENYEEEAEERTAAMAEANPWLFQKKASSGGTFQCYFSGIRRDDGAAECRGLRRRGRPRPLGAHRGALGRQGGVRHGEQGRVREGLHGHPR